MVLKYVVPVALAVALAGCGSFGAIGLPWKRDTNAQQPLPAPADGSAPVQTTDVGPPGSTNGIAPLPPDGTDTEAEQPLAPPTGTDTAMNAPTNAGAGGSVARTDLLGGWTITSGTDSCQLFMTLTSWTGGYRASTRGCNSNLLKSISAWNLQGSNVVLAGQGGAPVATLASAGNNRFDGTVSGQPISFFR